MRSTSYALNDKAIIPRWDAEKKKKKKTGAESYPAVGRYDVRSTPTLAALGFTCRVEAVPTVSTRIRFTCTTLPFRREMHRACAVSYSITAGGRDKPAHESADLRRDRAKLPAQDIFAI